MASCFQGSCHQWTCEQSASYKPSKQDKGAWARVSNLFTLKKRKQIGGGSGISAERERLGEGEQIDMGRVVT